MNGALVGDVYTALIVTTQLHRGDPFRYLMALFTNYKAVAAGKLEFLGSGTYRATQKA